MIAQINRLIARYEGDVQRAESESNRGRDELIEAKAIFEASERSLQEQMSSVKEECGLLLKSKDDELAAVKSELKALQDAKATMEAVAKSEAWASVNVFLSSKFKAVKDRLDMLRGETTMDFVNFSQAKNNLEFLQEVKQNPDLTFRDEKTRLKAEMAKYSDSEAHFDRVVDEIEAELSFLPLSPERTELLESEEAAEPQSGAVELAKTPELVEQGGKVRSDPAAIAPEVTISEVPAVVVPLAEVEQPSDVGGIAAEVVPDSSRVENMTPAEDVSSRAEDANTANQEEAV